MKVYKAKKGIWIHLTLGLVVLLPVVVFLLNPATIGSKLLILPLLVLPTAFIFWIYLNTYYGIGDGRLYYKSAFLKGNIPIINIREVLVDKTMWVGIRPAMATKGLIIKYNRFDEVYLAPVDKEGMLKDLLSHNHNIKVTMQ